MAGETTSAALIADAVPVYIAERTLEIATKETVFDDLAEALELPEGNGKTIQATRYERLPLPSAPLVEGVTPNSTPLTNSVVQAVVDQWGVLCTLTDVAQMTVKHPVLTIAIDRLGLNQAELRDREAQKTCMGGTNVVFGGTAASRSALAAGDNMTGDLIRKTTATLRFAGAPKRDGRYIWVVDSFVSQDIQKEPGFIQAHVYANTKALLNAEIGDWLGGRFKESNFIPIISRMAGADASATNAAVAGAETGFVGTSTVPVVVTRLDPDTGFETVISAALSASNAAAFTVDVTIAAVAVSGIYNVYVGLENAVVATLQEQGSHITGAIGFNGDGNVRSYIKAGTPNDAHTMVAQGTGPVAPPVPPAAGNVHISYAFGRQALGATKIGPKMQATLTSPLKTDSDPLGQRRKAGYKNMLKYLILNSKFYQRHETLSAFN
jgi:N4-gp56 family major capsid protein